MLFLLAWLEYAGIGVALTNFSVLFRSDWFSSIHAAEGMRYFGWVMAMVPLAQLLMAPVMGGLSDRFGRRPLILFGVIASFVGFLLAAMAIFQHCLWLLFVARLFTGLSTSNVGVIQSAMMDVTPMQDRTRGFNLLFIATGLGFSFGPVLGGVLADPTVFSGFSFVTPFWLLALLSFIMLGIVFFSYTETLRFLPGQKRESVLKVIKNPGLRFIFLSWALFIGGWTLYEHFFNNLIEVNLHLNLARLGYVSFFIGVVSLIFQIFLVRPLSRRFAPLRILRATGLGLGLMIGLLPFMPTIAFLLGALVFYEAFMALFLPNLLALLSMEIRQNFFGRVLGLVASLRAGTGFLVVPLGGVLASSSAAFPVIFGGLLIVVSWVIIMTLVHSKKESICDLTQDGIC